MKLTKRQREILEGLRYAQDHPLEDDAPDLVEEAGQWWFGFEQTNGKLGLFLLRNVLISPVDSEPYESGHGVVRRYEINSWGRRVLDDPDFEPMVEILKLRRNAERAAKALFESE